MFRFIVLQTAENVWREWGTGKKAGKLKCVFIISFFASFFLLPRFYLGICDNFALSMLLSTLSSFFLGFAATVFYYVLNVFWCLIHPLAGIRWMLSEEEKEGSYIQFFVEGRKK